MDLDRARSLLGVAAGADPAAVRAAHRSRIRRAHPDAGGTAEAAAALNAALALLLDPPPAPSPDRDAPPAPPTSGPASWAADPAADADSVFMVAERSDDLLLRLADAGHEVGEVVFVDPHSGILEIIVGEAPAVGQLAASVGRAGPEGTPVSFTLEPLGVTPAPPIADVVERLMAALSATR